MVNYYKVILIVFNIPAFNLRNIPRIMHGLKGLLG